MPRTKKPRIDGEADYMSHRAVKTWDFTWYPHLGDPDEQLEKWKNFDLSRLIIGLETCPTTGKLHWQGKVTWLRSYRRPQLEKLLPQYHLEESAVTKDFNYAMKDNIILRRDNSKQGSRTDIEAAMQAVRDEVPRRDLMEAHPGAVARYDPFLRSYRAEILRYTGPRVVVWAYGDSGTGKTSLSEEFLPGVQFKSVDFERGFALDYSGEQFVLIDEVSDESLAFRTLLRLLDRYDYHVNIKGSSVHWNAKVIYVTSEFHPQDLYRTTLGDKRQLLRRINGGVYKFPDQRDECRGALSRALDTCQAPSGGHGESSSDVSG